MQVDHYRPIAILPALSKVYERLVLNQLLRYIEQCRVLKSNITGYRKGHSTTTVLLRIRDDIINAIKKAFDTVDYSVVIRKLHSIGFSKLALRWMLSYLASRNSSS